MDLLAIASANVPALCVDTCSILDVMRDPARPSAKVHERQAAIDLVAAAEAGRLVCFMAEQVSIEFAQHDKSIQDEAIRSVENVREKIERINALSSVYGTPNNLNLSHLDDYVPRSRMVVERWLSRLERVTPGPQVHEKAFARMNAGISPAERGKESSKDCLIYETYLELISNLREAGSRAPITFLSSNTKEYLTDGKVIKSDIAGDFDRLKLIYAPNMSAAKYALKL